MSFSAESLTVVFRPLALSTDPPLFLSSTVLSNGEYSALEERINGYIADIKRNEKNNVLRKKSIKTLEEYLKGYHSENSRIKNWLYRWMNGKVATAANYELTKIWNKYKAESTQNAMSQPQAAYSIPIAIPGAPQPSPASLPSNLHSASSGIFQFDSSPGYNPVVPASVGSYQYPVMQMPYGTMNPTQPPTAPPSAGSSLAFQQGIRAYPQGGGYPPQGYPPQGYPLQTSSLPTNPYAQAPVQQPGYYYNGNYSTHPGYNNGPGYYQGNGSYPSSSG
ncbi:hypothetical protein B0H19DRAFT_1377411 [Mycena capillaripes]|nr:hypothetical protein B0H19DRAFT_1377411 [Mycena capillaripes]